MLLINLHGGAPVLLLHGRQRGAKNMGSGAARALPYTGGAYFLAFNGNCVCERKVPSEYSINNVYEKH